MRHIRYAGESSQKARELVEIGDRHGYQNVRSPHIPIGRRRHSLDAEPLQRQDIGHISDESAAIVSSDRNLHYEPVSRIGSPFNLKHPLGLQRAHARKALTITAMYRYTASEGYVTRYRLRAQRRTATRQCCRQVANTFNVDRRATNGFTRAMTHDERRLGIRLGHRRRRGHRC